MALLIEAGQMTASDYVPTYLDLPLASEGASTDAISATCIPVGEAQWISVAERCLGLALLPWLDFLSH